MFILGSCSPRRKEILSYFSLPFVQIDPSIDESAILFGGNPQKYCQTLAYEKALSLAKKHPNDIIITADTVVFANHTLYTKPKDEQEAHTMLQQLSGTEHSVFTGVCVVDQNHFHTQAEETKILFHLLTEKQIEAYHRHFYFLDKAGGYAIQKSGSIIVKHMTGCPYNVMGLPINTLRELLLKIGIDLWDYLSNEA
ncbi:MAG: septum formation protein Maf [Parachlamydiales bacterium]|nr:septum formation protein Maf [Parachlamydiales bacterium]